MGCFPSNDTSEKGTILYHQEISRKERIKSVHSKLRFRENRICYLRSYSFTCMNII